jgi:hypothetical protein
LRVRSTLSSNGLMPRIMETCWKRIMVNALAGAWKRSPF